MPIIIQNQVFQYFKLIIYIYGHAKRYGIYKQNVHNIKNIYNEKILFLLTILVSVPAFSQSADERIGTFLNQADWFGLEKTIRY